MSLTDAHVLNTFLTLQTQIKVYHWQTKVYSRHVASDKFFEKIVDLIDEFIEVYQGKTDRIKLTAETSKIQLANLSDKDIIDFLESIKVFLITGLTKFLSPTTDTDLLNIRDEMLGNVNRLLYLFTLK
jgi:hypothetical protein